MQHQDAERPQVRDLRPDVPEGLAAIVQRMMAKRPEDRYQIPLLVAAPLRQFISGGGSGLIRIPPGINSTAARPGTSPSLPPAKPASVINLRTSPPRPNNP
jgi:hypothetical protein